MSQILLGESSFNIVIQEGIDIVDKTLFIKEFLTSNWKVSCILRPRRFGKSLNLSMLRSFLSFGAKPETFERYNIGKEEKILREHCGQHPVVFLDLTGCSAASDWRTMYGKIWMSIRKMVLAHNKMFTSSEKEMPEYQHILSSQPPEEYIAETLLLWLTDVLYQIHGKRVFVLIDEYDAPLSDAFQKSFVDQVSAFMKSFYSRALKGNDSISRVCLMGIIEARGDRGLLSGLNNIMISSVASREYSKWFGFTEEETKALLPPDNCDDLMKIIKEWYNGYKFGGIQVLNPWSVLQFISKLPEIEPESYWVDSSATDTITKILNSDMKLVMLPIIEALYHTNYRTTDLTTRIDYSSEWTINRLLHYLVNIGYLTYEKLDGHGYVSIPNKEIRVELEEKIKQWMKDTKDFSSNASEMYRALNTFNISGLQSSMTLALQCSSYLDTTSEASYHIFFLGYIKATFDKDPEAIIRSNREAGNGRYDIMIAWPSSKKAVILELKNSTENSSLDNDARRALDQIIIRKYYEAFHNYNCWLVGVSFHILKVSPLYTRVLGANSNSFYDFYSEFE